MNIEAMAAAADRVSELMKTLASPRRLMILCQLAESERAVGDLAARLQMQSAAVSQQLALLRREGIVRTRREGQSVYYSLARGDVERLIVFLYEVYCREHLEKDTTP
ncbi:MAG: ArsR family transcriptional regulator [Rhodospirillales bacterium]|nr:MAG: ArsR family transcriptional regulator [Rhodospirillales bacterium]